MEIPAGAGAEVEITTLDAAELPSGLLTADAAMVGYELSPDVAKFSEA